MVSIHADHGLIERVLAMDTSGLTGKQRKTFEAARRCVGPNVKVLVVGNGTGHARMTKGLIGLIAAFAALFGLTLALLHVVLIPGALLFVVGIGLVRPRRGVALTPDGVFVLHESLWTGKPNRILLTALPAHFTPVGAKGDSKVCVQLGSEQVTFKRHEYDRLLRAVQSQASESAMTRGL